MTGASAQTRRNRVAGGRKAAATRKALAARRQAMLADMRPDGPLRGSAPVDGSVSTILARIRAAAPARQAEE